MRGARHYRPDVPTRLKKCSEHIGDDCNDCCSVTPCAYCIELEIYGEPIQHGYAPETAKHWTGTVDGHSFDMFWDRVYGECFLFVFLDGVEVYRKSCYEGQECRDSSDEAAVTIGYDDATLRWIKHEPFPLPHVIGDAGCPTWFCGDCECTCRTLCVSVEDQIDGPANVGTLHLIEGYPCDPPTWQGTSTDGTHSYEFTITLARDEYTGDCYLYGTVNGEAFETDTFSSGCSTLEIQWELYGNVRVGIRCTACGDCNVLPPPPCCDSSLPATLHATITLGNCPSPTTCSFPLVQRVIETSLNPNYPYIYGWYGTGCGMQLVVRCNPFVTPPRMELYSDQCTGAPIENFPTGFGQVGATVNECSPLLIQGSSTPSFECCPTQTTLTQYSVTL